MARKKGQTYTPEQKAKVVLELLKEEVELRNKESYIDSFLEIVLLD